MQLDLPPTFFYALAYVFGLIAALVVVNLALNRLTREERRTERQRRIDARARRAARDAIAPGAEHGSAERPR